MLPALRPYRTTPTQPITNTGYTGQHHNPSLGLIYYNARYYAPSPMPTSQMFQMYKVW